MKLLARYNRVTLLTTIIVMIITGIVYYGAISLILTRVVDKDLLVEENEIYDYVNLNHKLPQVFESNDQQISFSEAKPGSIKREFISTLYLKTKHHRHHIEREYESGRGLVTSVIAGGKYYRVLIVESTVETEDLIQIIFGITIGVTLLLLFTLFMTNRFALSRLWQPFHSQLSELRTFNVTENRDMPELDTTIDEFKELNKAVISMSARVKRDYTDLKTFTENASHELLTPIAVINSKLDTLLQTDTFTGRQSKLLNDLYGSISRLTRLNQSLLLLVKLENRLMDDHQHIDLKISIEELLIQFEEIFQDKELNVSHTLEEKVISASPYLVDILLNNLLGNAIRHNYTGGKIDISLDKNKLVIRNTGDDSALQQDVIFKRFNKSSGSEGSGLGLTISKQICENLGFDLSYSFKDHYHIFTVNF